MNTDKVYILQKDLPGGLKSGERFIYDGGSWYDSEHADDYGEINHYIPRCVENNPEWFKPEENKSNDSFQWSDDLVQDYVAAIILSKPEEYKSANDAMEKFKQSHTPKPQAENKPDWEIVAWEFADEIFKNKKFVENNLPEARIHSVKRLSDSEIFSVGDEVESFQWANQKIIGFIIGSDNTMIVEFETCRNPLSKIKKIVPSVLKMETPIGDFWVHREAYDKLSALPKFAPLKEEQRVERFNNIMLPLGHNKPINISNPTIPRTFEITENGHKLFRQEEVDSMCEDAFNAARKTKLSIDGFDVAYFYNTSKDYINSKQKQ